MQRSRGIKILVAVAAFGLVAAACGSDDDSGSSDTDSSGTGGGGESAAADAEFTIFGAPTGIEGEAVQGFLDVYNEQTGSNITFTGSDDLESQLEKAKDDLRAAKDQYGMLTLSGEQTILEAQMASVDGRLLGVQSEAASKLSQIEDLKAKLESMSPEVVTQTVDGFGNEATDGMRQQLYELEIKERELLSKYKDNHPFIAAVRKQREAVEKILKEQPEGRTQMTRALNPTYLALHQQMLEAGSAAAALEGEATMLAKQQEKLNADLEALNKNEVLIARLQRKADLLETRYLTYAKNLEESRIDQALDDDRISSVNVMQPATYVAAPVSPKKKLVLIIGLFVGTFGAIGIALFAEAMDDTVRTVSEFEQALEMPVLLTVPDSARHASVTW